MKKIHKNKYNWCGGKKGSVLVVTLIIFGIIVVTALSVALSTVRQIRTSMQSSKTNIAYQNADEGVDKVMTAILKGKKTVNSDGNITINSVTGDECKTGIADPNKKTVQPSSVKNYEVELQKTDGIYLACDDSTDDIFQISQLRAIGNDPGLGTQRIISANVQQKDEKIKLLLHFDTDSNASTLKIVDSSRVHHEIENTSVTIGTESTAPIYPNYGIGDFSGSNKFLKIKNDEKNDWQFGDDDYTVDFWVYINNNNGEGGNEQIIFDMSNNSSNVARIYYENKKLNVTLGTTKYNCLNEIATDAWRHIALVRNDSKIKFYVDGKSGSSGECNLNDGMDITDNTNADLKDIRIGAGESPQKYFNGKIDELRVYDGVFWTSDFDELPSKPY
jgi:hypothetical protein